MKKIVICLAAVAALSAVPVYAAETTYVTDEKYVSCSEADKYKTVLVLDEAESIVYINQEDTGFSSASKFFLSSEPEAGTYTLKLGGGNEANIENKFYIGIDDIYGDVTAGRIGDEGGIVKNEDGTYNIGYIADIPAGAYRSILVKDGDRILGYSINTVTSGDGDIRMGIQINGVPEEKKESLEVSLSARAVELAADNTAGGEE